MIIRKYESADCAVLAKLFYDTVHSVNSKDYTKEQIDVWATGIIDLDKWNNSYLEHNTLVAERDGIIVGFADMDKKGYINMLYVHKDYQGQGIATALINKLERNAREENVICFETYASITAKPFFEKLGYIVQRENTVVREGISLINFHMKKIVNIEIKPLTPDLAADFFDFFDNRAFTDNSPYRCYCQIYQMTKEQQKAASDEAKAYGLDGGSISRKVAERQINAGILQGYLAFADGVAIGWCNANGKSNFPIESCTGEHFYAPAEKREKAVVCFEISPEYRGKGVATALLQRVLADAKAEHYIAVEGFPVLRDDRYEWDSTGPVRLYEKAGFVKVAETEKKAVMRKELR
ncbi:MAG: GNAT family N-acetyltransferase [Saccharofermentanales bacterium]